MHWTFMPEPWRRYYPSMILLPPASSDGSPKGEEAGREGIPVEAGDRRRRRIAWRKAGGAYVELIRPQVVGRGQTPRVDGGKVFQIDLAEGDSLGSIALVSVDALLGQGGATSGVRRLGFSEVGEAMTIGDRLRISVEVDDREVPDGLYVLHLVTRSGLPSLGDLVEIEGVREHSSGASRPGPR